jgi:hypothetical protein
VKNSQLFIAELIKGRSMMGNGMNENQISTRELVRGYQQWVMEYINQEWTPYEISFMYHPLPGSQRAVLEQMKRELYRVNSKLVTRFERSPASKSGFNRLPRMMLFPDLPVYKRTRPTPKDVFVNDGLHYGGIALTPPKSRIEIPMDAYFDEKESEYLSKRLERIHVEPITSDAAYVTDYVAKSIKRGTTSLDDIVILPRTRDEL